MHIFSMILCSIALNTYISFVHTAPFTTASMMIIIDASEFLKSKKTALDVGANESNLIKALHEKEYLIIASYPLLDTILKNKELLAKVGPDYFSEQDLNSWVCKKITDLLYLLIPITYNNIPELKKYVPHYFKKNEPLTQLELTLGLKIDHLETVDIKTLEKKYYVPTMNESLEDDFINNLSNIFISNKEYTDAKTTVQKPEWAFFLTGHGDIIEHMLREYIELLQNNGISPLKDLQQINKIYTILSQLPPLFEKLHVQHKNCVQTDFEPGKIRCIKNAFDTLKSIHTLLLESANYLGYSGVKNLDISATEKAIQTYKMGNVERLQNIIETTASIGKILEPITNLISEFAKASENVIKVQKMQAAGIHNIFAGLPSNKFQNFLDFLNSKISTKILCFTTCYAGGKSLDLLYQDQKKSVQKTFNFIIASNAITEAPSAAGVAENDLFMRALGQFAKFFASLRTDGVIDFVQTLDYATGFFEEGNIEYSENLPLLKLPGREWVSVIDIPNKIVSIGKTLARARNPNQPLDVSKFFAGRIEKPGISASKIIYPEVMLLYAENIPFTLKFTHPPTTASWQLPPIMISMISGDAVHEFTGIDASQFGFYDFIESHFEDVYPQKVFVIKELTVKNDIKNWPIPNNEPALKLTNVIIFASTQDPLNKQPKPTEGIYFTLSGKYYRSWWIPKERQELPENELENFTQLKSDYINAWLNTASTIKSANKPNAESVFAQSLEELKKFIEQQPKEKDKKSLVDLSKELQKLANTLNKLNEILNKT